MLYLANAFSLGMLENPQEVTIYVTEIDIEQVKELLANGFTSAIGHESTAAILSNILGIQVPVNRVPIKAKHGDDIIVFQLLQRLPEGKILSEQELQQLIQQKQVRFYYVEIVEG